MFSRFGSFCIAVLSCVISLQAIDQFACAIDLVHGRIVGSIVDTQGTPVSNALVFVHDGSFRDKEVQTRSDGQGKFSLDVSTSDTVAHRNVLHLIVDAEGFAPLYISGTRITLFDNAESNLGELILDRGVRFRGRVVDSKGIPIPKASVHTTHRRYARGNLAYALFQLDRTVLTEVDGTYETPPMMRLLGSFSVMAEGYQEGWHPKEVIGRTSNGGQLPDLVLQRDISFDGIVVDPNGDPVANAEVSFSSLASTYTKDDGRFSLSGLEPSKMNTIYVLKEGHGRASWEIARDDTGYRVHDGRDEFQLNQISDREQRRLQIEKSAMLMKELKLTIHPASNIRGKVVDEVTQQPVKIDQIILCKCTRDKSGKALLSGCSNTRFRQINQGEFEIEYNGTSEYHLWIKADGYHDAEAFAEVSKFGLDINGLDVKMRPKTLNAVVSHPIVRGTLHGPPDVIKHCRVGLFAEASDALPSPRVFLLRNRTVEFNIIEASSTVVNGEFSLVAPSQGSNWYALVENLSGPIAVQGPLSLEGGENPSLDITISELGELHGSVADYQQIGGPVWAVLFSRHGILYETQMHSDGRFAFENLLPGEYGLKVAREEIFDSEVPKIVGVSNEELQSAFAQSADPWRRAKVVTIEPTRDLDVGEVVFTP